jgi:hypothetical protein
MHRKKIIAEPIKNTLNDLKTLQNHLKTSEM